MIKHKVGVENKVTDALSRRVSILVAVSNEVTRFERIKNDYESCPDFGEVYKSLADGLVRERNDYFLLNGYLFKANKLCILSRGAHSIRKNQKIEPFRLIRVGLDRFMEATDLVRFRFLKIR